MGSGDSGPLCHDPESAQERDLGNTDILTVGPGDILHIVCGGAGGWGNPLERPAEQVALDVRRSFVSEHGAERGYGVIVRDGVVDEMATAAERERRRDEVTGAFYHFGDARDDYERVWSRSNYATLTAVLDTLPVHWRYFVKHRIFEAVEEQVENGIAVDVRALFDTVLVSYPQLRHAMSA